MPTHPEFRPLWESAGYTRGYGSSAVVKPPPSNKRRLYYLTGPDYAVSNLVFGRLKIARFAELNDPFELLGTNLGLKNARSIVRTHKADYNERYGVICFSEDWVDPVLWSHYASKHKGVALGFDVDIADIVEVSYTEKRLKKVSESAPPVLSANLEELLFATKFESWNYEREWRLRLNLVDAEQEGGFYFNPFSKKMVLREVILGALCDFSMTRMRKLVNTQYRDVITFKAQLAKRSFRIIALGSTVP